MELTRLVAHINSVTDEDFDFMQVIGFINDAVAKINSEAGAKFPFIDETDGLELLEQDEWTALSETWIRQLIVPYAAGRIKENDSSQFEYTDWYAQFEMNLAKFITKYSIPVQYQDTTSREGRYEDDYAGNMFSPMRGW